MSAGKPVLVDTSAWVETLRKVGDAETRAEVRRLTLQGLVRLCDPVRLELWNSTGSEADRRLLERLQEDVESVETTPEVWGHAQRLAWASRRAGLTLPAIDLLVAACARVHGLGLLHRDAHFDRLAEISPR